MYVSTCTQFSVNSALFELYFGKSWDLSLILVNCTWNSWNSLIQSMLWLLQDIYNVKGKIYKIWSQPCLFIPQWLTPDMSSNVFQYSSHVNPSLLHFQPLTITLRRQCSARVTHDHHQTPLLWCKLVVGLELMVPQQLHTFLDKHQWVYRNLVKWQAATPSLSLSFRGISSHPLWGVF